MFCKPLNKDNWFKNFIPQTNKVKTLQVKINSPINYKASGIGKVQFYSTTRSLKKNYQ